MMKTVPAVYSNNIKILIFFIKNIYTKMVQENTKFFKFKKNNFK